MRIFCRQAYCDVISASEQSFMQTMSMTNAAPELLVTITRMCTLYSTSEDCKQTM